MVQRAFIQCDVFSAIPLQGNGLAVVLNGEGLSERQMQDFASWTNLSEAAFILSADQPEADYRVRIFSPTRELAFAGHPTLGSCAAWLHAGGVPKQADRVLQECNIGIVPIELGHDLPAFVAPRTEVAAMAPDVQARIVDSLGIDEVSVLSSAVLDNGSIWHVLELNAEATLMAVNASRVEALPGLGIGLLSVSRPGSGSQFDVRMLSDRSPRCEDPITGSLNAAIGIWLLGHGRLTRPTIMAQGSKVGRNGEVHLLPGPAGSGQVLVGGRTHILIDGTIEL